MYDGVPSINIDTVLSPRPTWSYRLTKASNTGGIVVLILLTSFLQIHCWYSDESGEHAFCGELRAIHYPQESVSELSASPGQSAWLQSGHHSNHWPGHGPYEGDGRVTSWTRGGAGVVRCHLQWSCCVLRCFTTWQTHQKWSVRLTTVGFTSEIMNIMNEI